MLDKVVCLAPFTSIFLKDNLKYELSALPCCATNTDVEPIIVDQSKTLRENFDQFRGWRKEFLENGLDKSKYTKCTQCLRNPNSQSLAHNSYYNYCESNSIDIFNDPKILHLHLNFNNKCNLACRMCGPISSSRWAKEYAEGEDIYKPSSYFIKSYIDENSVLYKTMFEDLKEVRYIHFSGGEPFLQEGMWNVLRYLDSMKKYDVELQYNTNGTVLLNEEQKNLLKKFSNIQLHVSMDGTEKLAEYTRTGLVWDQWLKNLSVLRDISPKRTEIIITVSVFNVHKIKEICEYFDQLQLNISLNYLYGPEYMCIRNLNHDAKKHINQLLGQHERFAAVLKLLNLMSTIPSRNVAIEIERRDNITLNKKLYKRFRPFKEIEPEWFNIIAKRK